MSRTRLRIAAGLVLLCGWASPLNAAELTDLMPADTVLYIGWPGADALGQSSKDTAWGKLMAEPEIVRFRERWNKEVWPAIDKRLHVEMNDPLATRAYEAARDLLAAAWKYPTALAFVGASPEGPQIDAGLIIRAGDGAPQLAKQLEALFNAAVQTADGSVKMHEVQAGDAKLKEVLIHDAPPIRFGALGPNLVITMGKRLTEHWASGVKDKSLTTAELFVAAAKVTGASPATPILYLDFKNAITTIENFQPQFASLNLPILGEPGGLTKILDKIGVGKLQSVSVAMRPDAGGFRTVGFAHAPGVSSGSGLFGQKPLTDEDLKFVPKEVYWASVDNADLAGFYKYLLGCFQTISPEYHGQAMPYLADFEKWVGVKIHDELLASFADTWVIYDSPNNAGLWFTGITVIAELRPENKLDISLQRLVEAIAEAVGDHFPITVEEEAYREQKIRYVNIPSIPVPVSPAWTIHNGRWIFALYPQVVRTTLDSILDKDPSILDNPDFQRGRKLMPANFTSIGYSDSPAGIRQIYSLVLPLASMGFSILQGQGIPLQASMLPTAKTMTKHMFGSVGVNVMTKDGILSESHGAYPFPTPGGGTTGSSTLPLLMPGMAMMGTRMSSPVQSVRAPVGMTNLQKIGIGCLVYAEAHQGLLPPDLATLVKEGHVAQEQIQGPNGEQYEYIAGLKNTMDPRCITAYEKLDPNSSKKVNAVFLDGHVQSMSPGKLQKLVDGTKDMVAGKLAEGARKIEEAQGQ